MNLPIAVKQYFVRAGGYEINPYYKKQMADQSAEDAMRTCKDKNNKNDPSDRCQAMSWKTLVGDYDQDVWPTTAERKTFTYSSQPGENSEDKTNSGNMMIVK